METSVFRPVLTDASAGRTFLMLGATMRLLATAADTGRRYTVLEQITPPGWGPPRHIHSREDEIFYILEGSYDLHVGGEHRTVSSGASAILPRNVPHGFRNASLTPSRLLCVIPPGGLEEYFLAVAKCSPLPDPAQADRIGATVWLDSVTAGSFNAEWKSLRLL